MEKIHPKSPVKIWGKSLHFPAEFFWLCFIPEVKVELGSVEGNGNASPSPEPCCDDQSCCYWMRRRPGRRDRKGGRFRLEVGR